MITALFERSGDRYLRVEIAGHAGYAEAGEDIVCAAVTSALELTANTLTEVMALPAAVQVRKDSVALCLESERAEEVRPWQQLVEGLYRHLSLLSRQYPGHVRVCAAAPGQASDDTAND